MKKLIILLIIIILLPLFSGCVLPDESEQLLPFSHLKDFNMPNNSEFINTIEALDAPEKICQYMSDNFKGYENLDDDYTPYQMFQIKQGDCADYSCFAAFAADYHNIETYLVYIILDVPWSENIQGHLFTIYKVDNNYTFSDYSYYTDGFNSISDIIDTYAWVIHYTIYDCQMNIIETF
jgi:hypothetical protein